MILPVQGHARSAVLAAVLAISSLLAVGSAQARPRGRARGHAAAAPLARVAPGLRVAVQPIGGEAGPALRSQIARLLRGRGCRVVTTLPRVEGTGQYPTMAKDNRLAAFVAADLEERGRWSTVTFLVWDGASGNVLGRWSASALSKNLPKAVAKGFWKSLGPRLESAQAPASDDLGEAAPMYVNAGEPLP